MKRISTYISPNVWRAMKAAVEAEGVKLWRFVEEAVKLRIADYERRKQVGGDKEPQTKETQVN
jgi:nucleoid-associated protein YgaU